MRWLLGLGLLAGLSGTAVIIGVGGVQGKDLRLKTTPLGCGVLHLDGRCELFEQPELRELRLYVDSDPDTTLYVAMGVVPLNSTVEWVQDGRLLRFSVPTCCGSLRLLARHNLHWKSITLPVADWQAPGWLREARTRWYSGYQQAPVRAALESRLHEPLSVEQRAHILGILARIAREQDRVDDARRLFAEALGADKAAGLVSNELDDAMSLARLFNERDNQVIQAEALWKERAALLARMPEIAPWQALSMSIYRQKLGDLRKALQVAEEGISQAHQVGENAVLVELLMQRSTVLVQMGRHKDAEEGLKSQLTANTEACRHGELLADQARLRIMERTVLPSGLLSDRGQDPSPLLEDALKKDAPSCNQPLLTAKIVTRLAVAAGFDHAYPQALAYVNQARRELSKSEPAKQHPAPELELDWLDVEGKAAIAEKRFDDAAKSYRAMVKLSQNLDDFEAYWRANIGLAQALEDVNKNESRESYRRAVSYLEERSLNLPISNGRGSFLGRFEQGIGLYVDFLHREGLDEEAMAVARRARARSVRTLSLTRQIEYLDEVTRKRWEEKLSLYQSRRQELDHIITRLNAAAGDDVPNLQRQRDRQQKNLTDSMEEALGVLGERSEPPALDPPGPGEVVLTCHPAKDRWLCFAADSLHVESTSIAQLDTEVPTEVLSEQLILPFADMLRNARRVRVIAYGALRKVDIHLLKLSGKELGDGREIVYALDVPFFPRSPADAGDRPASGPAILLFDLDDTLPESRDSADTIAKMFTAAKWKYERQVGSRPSGPKAAGVTSDADSMDADKLQEKLGQASFFHFAGHADITNGIGMSTLRTTNRSGLLVGDLLLLDHVPPAVALFACGSGLSPEEVGGVEGLGIAQAFLLRGSKWVVGTVRNVHDRLAAPVAIEFYRRLKFSDVSITPYAALRAAVLEVKKSLRIPDAASLKGLSPENDLGAFRIFVR